jgi:hypothetical protein
MQDNETKRFKRFNDAFAYYLGNVFRFVWTLFRFFIKLAGVSAITFPLILFGMCLVSPDSAVQTIEAFARFLNVIVELFR